MKKKNLCDENKQNWTAIDIHNDAIKCISYAATIRLSHNLQCA